MGPGRWLCWIDGDVTALPPLGVDLATMTGNAAQAVVAPEVWRRTLRGAYEALRPGGRLVFETRDPWRRAWEEWHREESYRVTEVPGGGVVFASDGQAPTSDSTLRFRERREIEDELETTGFVLEDVRDAPDRPGKEFVFVARRP